MSAVLKALDLFIRLSFPFVCLKKMSQAFQEVAFRVAPGQEGRLPEGAAAIQAATENLF